MLSLAGAGSFRTVYKAVLHFKPTSVVAPFVLESHPTTADEPLRTTLVALQILHLDSLRRRRSPYFAPDEVHLESGLEVLRREHAIYDVLEASEDHPGRRHVRCRLGAFLVNSSVIMCAYEWCPAHVMTPNPAGVYSVRSYSLVLYNELGARRLARELVLALQFLGDNGVAHRDIKPHNLFLTREPPQEWLVHHDCDYMAPHEEEAEDDFLWFGAPTFTRGAGLSEKVDSVEFRQSLFGEDLESECDLNDEAALRAAIAAGRNPRPLRKQNDPSQPMLLVADFNSAHLLSGRFDSGGEGTRSFVPPECFRLGHEPIEAEKRDVWSLGCVVVSMLTGRPPFHHTNPTRLLSSILSEEVTVPSLFGPATSLDSDNHDLTPECVEFLRGTLNKDPTARWSLQQCLDSSWLAL